MSVIDEMSRLILADPNVTAKEIARHLGYAEEKSVYYWLQKSGFTGMRDFKKNVLTRVVSRPSIRPEPALARDAAGADISLFTDQDQNTGATLQDHLAGNLGHGSYGVVVTRHDCRPLAGVGDILIVDPGAPSFQGDLMWASVRGKMRLVRQYGLPDQSLFYVDPGQPGSVLSPDFVSGKVLFILKKHP